jgi:hypothetical protein
MRSVRREHELVIRAALGAGVADPRKLLLVENLVLASAQVAVSVVLLAGVLAFSVSARTNEIGIRMSLGADSARIQRMVIMEGGVLLAIGLVLGMAAAKAGSWLIEGLLFGVPPHDPLTRGLVAGIMAAIGIGACWLPATRAARIEPASACGASSASVATYLIRTSIQRSGTLPVRRYVAPAPSSITRKAPTVPRRC